MLNLVNTAPTPIADAVMELHALYLVEGTSGTGFSGVAPTGTTYGPSALMAGTTAATTTLASIKAVRIGLILKSPLLEKMQNIGGNWTHVAPSSLTLFSDVPNAAGTAGTLTYTRTLDPGGVCTASTAVTTNPGGNSPLTTCERDYRYRTVEITVPLRNPMLLS
jgi:type IV pilus assembly protein PilW